MELPESVQEIADVIGREDALYLIGQLPTCETVDPRCKATRTRVMLYVPKRLKGNHRLVQILGEKQAQKLVEGFGGENLQVANCNGIYREWRDSEVRRMSSEGMSSAQLADIMQVSKRHISNIIRRAGLTGAAIAASNVAND